ncbi:hypothetical protein F0562_001766 [Nyssa sinensis]|uniref:Retrotransposon gag domain-containing protein n=1 Tax=Nyssa sinensis TaxID=561372 RepID=A0A5J5C7Z8_9ASTE|nr:hypothetical protein F0562_001766 [Nyssa sinensis]
MEKMAVARLVLVLALSPCATTLPVFLAVGNSPSMMVFAIIVLLFSFMKWNTKDAIINGWLLKTMEPHLLGLFLSLPTTKDVWEGFSQMYYNGFDESQMYELCCKATYIEQGGRPIPLYFAELKSIWQELDKRRPIKMICVADIKVRQEELVKDCVYDFLAGLDDGFDKVHSDLLRMKPLPRLEELFAYVRREALMTNYYA